MTRLAETIYNGHFSTHPFERTTAAGSFTAPAGGGRPAEAPENPYEPAQTGGSRPARKQAGPHGPEPPRPTSAARKCSGPGSAPRRPAPLRCAADRKSTRLNSSHVKNSYAVVCLK